MDVVTFDFETRSEADLRKVGAYQYAIHPSTDVLCNAWLVNDDPAAGLWHPGFEDLTPLKKAKKPKRNWTQAEPSDVPKPAWDTVPHDLLRPPDPEALFDMVEHPNVLFEAHNAFFERCIWTFVMVRKYGWPEMDPAKWRCSAAKAAMYSLPRALEKAVKAINLPAKFHKDMAGNRTMLKMSKPRKPTKVILADLTPEQYYKVNGTLWNQNRTDLLTTFRYCIQDVRAERALSRSLRPMPPKEIRIWQMDQDINWRGIGADLPLIKKALVLVDEEQEACSKELDLLTDGGVTKHTRRGELLNWACMEGIDLENTQAATIELLSEDPDLEPYQRRIFQIWRSANRSSTKKYVAMLARCASDNRIRDILRYHGANTGRWAGVGIQPQNMARGFTQDMMDVCRDILDCDRETLRFIYGDVMVLLSHAIRGALIAGPGKDLIVSDFSAVEARGTFWVSGHEEGLEAFRQIDAGKWPGQDIYTWQATKMFGRTIYKKDSERQSGKVVVLGAGYQMGWKRLIEYAASMGVILTPKQAKELIDGYRETNFPVTQFWDDIEEAAKMAVLRGPGGKAVHCGPISFGVRGRFLHCRLPSGRLLSYYDPKIRPVKTPWGEIRPAVHFMAVHQKTGEWWLHNTYGGKLTENVVQALCRDLMADAMLRLVDQGWSEIVLTVHDEIVSEIDERMSESAQERFDAVVAEVPDWAPGFPIQASGWRGKRYRKD